MSQKTAAILVRNVEAWGDAFPPPCACGCGEPTKFSASSGINKYLNRQHVAYDKDYSVITKLGNDKRQEGNIPIEDFRAAVKKIKAQKGWSYSEMARRGGQSEGWLSCYMFDDRLQTVGKDTASLFLRRCAGLPAPPSRFQERQARKIVPNAEKAIQAIGMDAEPPKEHIVDWSMHFYNQSRIRNGRKH
jgi:transcriptional regulator with XRE-family HTH domain